MISQITSVPRSVRGVFYGWWLVPLTGFIKVLTSVPLFHAMTVWSVALESHFGWSRTQLSLAFTLTRVEGGIMGPVEGYLTEWVSAPPPWCRNLAYCSPLMFLPAV